jgi:hypothetical protein
MELGAVVRVPLREPKVANQIVVAGPTDGQGDEDIRRWRGDDLPRARTVAAHHEDRGGPIASQCREHVTEGAAVVHAASASVATRTRLRPRSWAAGTTGEGSRNRMARMGLRPPGRHAKGATRRAEAGARSGGARAPRRASHRHQPHRPLQQLGLASGSVRSGRPGRGPHFTAVAARIRAHSSHPDARRQRHVLGQPDESQELGALDLHR